ncbi:hypothetical protein BB561_003652 [Smittium simulii]|uniref:Target of rapamycin complex subunit LST8 n=1 Tax=Smittium simulii TaxID=133385 RepID=A0A2T9YK62_9FUNG|nr:hypothetical protein BB561_003652 [Smittium simulii]
MSAKNEYRKSPSEGKRSDPNKQNKQVLYEDNAVVLVTSGHDRTIRMWDALKSTCTKTIQFVDSPVTRMALSPDKRYLAAVGAPFIKLYDVFSSSQSPILSLEGHKSAISAVKFTNDMRYLVTSSEDKSMRIWNLRTGACEQVIENNTVFNDVAIYPGFNHDIILSCDQGGFIKVWCVSKKKVLLQLELETQLVIIRRSIRTIALSPDGTLIAAGGNNGQVLVWRLTISQTFSENPTSDNLKSHKNSPNIGNRKSQNKNYKAHAELVATIPAHPDNYMTRIVFSGNGSYLVTCSSDKTAKVWAIKLTKNKNNNILVDSSNQNTEPNTISDTQLSSDSNSQFSEQNDSINSAISSNQINNQVNPVDDSNVQKISSSLPYTYELNYEIFHILKYHKGWVWDAAFSNDSGYLVTVSSDKTAALWDVMRGKVIREFIGHEKGVLCVSLNDATTL